MLQTVIIHEVSDYCVSEHDQALAQVCTMRQLITHHGHSFVNHRTLTSFLIFANIYPLFSPYYWYACTMF